MSGVTRAPLPPCWKAIDNSPLPFLTLSYSFEYLDLDLHSFQTLSSVTHETLHLNTEEHVPSLNHR
ncbi:hypothetical protein T440DRAFT_473530 [Plenodomus tracheiphilus IPT5]|uniref:Uncharacterized protein n=1 Tax=Plenodomus tracheiphilus IPT5 TaxID=1408161 RepID=A0A6A7AQ28_9PLEO|nr:hypothetical protein T440DRAFT_473530 [Plenodomus tracheiphilus IPT5]